MKLNNIALLNNVTEQIETALTLSTFEFESSSSTESWAKYSLQKNVTEALKKVSETTMLNNSLNSMGGGGTNPPGSAQNGFKALFGLQILIGYKIRFKATADIGTGYRFGDFGITNSLHFAAYNDGLGVGIGKHNLVVDVTAAVNLTVGAGQGTPLPSYSLNYNSQIPNLNTFQNSFSYGQLFTYNSALHNNRFSFDDIQRQGMIGFRIGDVNVSSNNDTSIGYFGDGDDKGWTGGITFATPLLEFGFQDFSGSFNKSASVEKEHAALRKKVDNLKKEIKAINKDKSLSDIEKKKIILDISRREKVASIELKRFTNNKMHTQSSYQRNLNKASTFFRFNDNGNTLSIDIIENAWLQNMIHKAIKDLRFEYDEKNIQVWGGTKH